MVVQTYKNNNLSISNFNYPYNFFYIYSYYSIGSYVKWIKKLLTLLYKCAILNYNNMLIAYRNNYYII